MDLKEALPLLQENHLAVATSVSANGRPQGIVVSTAILDGKLVFASPADTVKVKNIQRTGRGSLTVIKFDTRRYVTIEGLASFEPWEDTQAHIQHLKGLKDLYVASARTPKGTDEEFAQQMRKEKKMAGDQPAQFSQSSCRSKCIVDIPWIACPDQLERGPSLQPNIDGLGTPCLPHGDHRQENNATEPLEILDHLCALNL